LDRETAQRLIAEIAPQVEGTFVSEVRSPGPGCFLLELRGGPDSGRRGDDRSPGTPRGMAGTLGVVTMKAMPLIFFRPGVWDALGRAARGPRSSLGQAAGSVIVSLRSASSGAGAVLDLSHTSAAGRTVTRSVAIGLGKGRDRRGGAGGSVMWWHDRSDRLHVRLSMRDAAPPRDAGEREMRAFDSLNEGACFMFERFWAVLEAERRRGQLKSHVDRRLKRTERAMEKVKSEIEDAARAEEYRHVGQLLLTRQQTIPRGQEDVTVKDYDGRTPVTIRVDPSIGIQQNAEVFFRKARKAERRGVRAPRRLKELEVEALRLRVMASEIEGAGEERLTAMEKEIRGRDPRQTGRPAGTRPRFRTYVVSGGWEVLVGKSSRDNDTLTHKMARPNDLWFHARQVPGSHVILRRSGSKAEPDRQAILEAAAIAAYHSKAGKSSKVSVCYTERRHVRKARGGQPGEAVVSREKVVMVRPGLPES
jgi:hypothetical protein